MSRTAVADARWPRALLPLEDPEDVDFTWLGDPAALLGLGTLILLELVLGIDNLVFLAILSERLPPAQQGRARIVGLSLALFMRLALLFAISWVASLTRPLFTVAGMEVSGRDLILLAGGLFLLFKATVELHERLEGGHAAPGRKEGGGAAFWQVIAQIVALDAVFSLDSVITAVGMVDNLEAMVIAIVIAVGVMLVAARPLTEFVGRHPTVVVLCLSFLLMIGLSLIADGFGFHIPKGYLYAAIGFSVLIEAFNQTARRNRVRRTSESDMRERTAAAVLRLLGGGPPAASSAAAEAGASAGASAAEELGLGATAAPAEVFAPEERSMVQGVISLGERTLRSIMTPRTEVAWLDLAAPTEETRRRVLESGHSRFPVARGRLDELVGLALAKDVLPDLLAGRGLDDTGGAVRPALVLPDGTGVLAAMERLRAARVHLAVVVDEHGTVEGVVTPTDILEAIAGDFRAEDEAAPRLDAEPDGSWLVDGQTDLHRLGRALGADLAEVAGGRYATLAGHLMWRLGRLPEPGERLAEGGLEFEVESLSGYRPALVRVRRRAADDAAAAAAD